MSSDDAREAGRLCMAYYQINNDKTKSPKKTREKKEYKERLVAMLLENHAKYISIPHPDNPTKQLFVLLTERKKLHPLGDKKLLQLALKRFIAKCFPPREDGGELLEPAHLVLYEKTLDEIHLELSTAMYPKPIYGIKLCDTPPVESFM